MSLWTVSYKLLHIYIRYEAYLYEVTCEGGGATWWSSTWFSCALLLPGRCFAMQVFPLLHLEEICDVGLSAFAWPLQPVASPGGHLQVLIPWPRCVAGIRGSLAWRRWRPPPALFHPSSGPRHWPHHWPHHAAAVKCRHILALELLPLDVGAFSWYVGLEIIVPPLVGHLHAHAEQPLEVLPQLLVVHGPEEIPPHRPHL